MTVRIDGATLCLGADQSRTTVFSDLTAALPTDRRCIIYGDSGTGKSTLIRAIAGMLRPEHGSIERFARLSYPVGYSGAFSSKLTLFQNLSFAAELYEIDEQDLVGFVAHWADVDPVLSVKLSLIPAHLRVRVAYTLSYAIPFDTYLVDNAISAGDPAFRERCLRLFNARMESAGCIMATRNWRIAERFGDCGAAIVDGQLVYFDDIEKLVDFARSSPAPQASEDSQLVE